VLGIDLGTTNSAIAEIVWDPSKAGPVKARCLEVEQATCEGRHIHTLVPSVVAIHDGKVFIGEGAKRLRAEAPAKGLAVHRNLFYECKNDMGIKKSYPRAPEGFRSAPEIAGKILRFLYEAAVAEDATPVERVVVTVPASFQAAQRSDTLDAAGLAGLSLTGGDLLDEPLAAFLDYIFSYEHETVVQPGEDRHLVVFDFGGGTCDVAVFRLRAGNADGCWQIATLAVSRYHRLGGSDIDRAIVHEVLIPELLRQNGLGTFDLGWHQKKNIIEPALLGVAEALKIGLSQEISRLASFGKYTTANKDVVVSSYPGTTKIKLGKEILVLRNPSLSAAQFETLLKPFLDRDLLYARETEYRMTCSVFAPLEDAVEKSGLDAAQIDYCLMAGGSSFIPQVLWAVKDYFPAAEILTYPDWEAWQTSVARGAAYHALALAVRGKGFLQPVCPEDVAIRTEKGLQVLVPRGTPLPYPADVTYAKLEGLTVPRAVETGCLPLRVQLVAGPEARSLFTAIWEIPAPVRAGEPLCLLYRYDENQVLDLQLFLARDASVAFAYFQEKPLTNVVNPESKWLKIYELEEAIRQGEIAPTELPEKLVELADLYADLRQHEKAVEFLRQALRKKGRPDAEILNKMGIYCGELGNAEQEEKYYREAAACSGGWGGPLFNLALAQKRRGEIRAATESVEKALMRERRAPYLILRAQLAGAAGEQDDYHSYLRQGLDAFAPPKWLGDWELGWLATAAQMAGDDELLREAQEERRRRARGRETGEAGDLPDYKHS